MEFIRKKKEGIKFTYNKKVLLFIVLLALMLTLVIYFIVKNDEGESELGECKVDSDCVPATCCHPDTCVPKENSPNCDRVMCSMGCSGPLDCGAGSCSCAGGKCNIPKKE